MEQGYYKFEAILSHLYHQGYYYDQQGYYRALRSRILSRIYYNFLESLDIIGRYHQATCSIEIKIKIISVHNTSPFVKFISLGLQFHVQVSLHSLHIYSAFSHDTTMYVCKEDKAVKFFFQYSECALCCFAAK